MNLKPGDMLKSAISSEDDFQRLCPLLADLIKSSKLPVCKEVISEIKKQIKSSKVSPPEKLRALKALNTLMMVGNVHFLLFAGKKIMERLGILASHKKELSIEMRAESLFGKNSSNTSENRTASLNFLNCLLDYIKSWASEFGKAPDKSDSAFFTTYNKLKESGVRFPVKQPGRVQREEKKNSKTLSFLEQVEGILKLLEDSEDENMNKEYREMLRVHKTTVENALQDAMNHNNSNDIEVLLAVMDKITEALDSKKLYPRLSEGKRGGQNFFTGSPGIKSVPNANKGNFDLFDLEIEPSGTFEHSKASAFVSHQPIILPEKEKPSLFPSNQVSLFPPSSQNSLFPSSSLFPTSPEVPIPQEKKIMGRSSLFPEENYGKKNLDTMPSLFPQENYEKYPISINLKADSQKEDSLMAKLKLENSQLLEALEMCKSMLKDKESIILNLNSELKKALSDKEKKEEELAEALEVANYLEKKLKKNKKKVEKVQNKEPDFFAQSVKSEPDFFAQPGIGEKKEPVKSSSDFDLDFILSPKKVVSNEPVVIQPVINVSQTVVAENSLQYRMGNCMEMGILYDSETLQVGFQVKRQANDLFCILFIGNKSTTPITEINTELLDVSMESFPIVMQPLRTNEELLQNAQTNRMIKAQLSGYTAKVPRLNIFAKSQGIEQICVKLPLTIARFMEARQELPTSMWIEWKKLVFEEDTSVVQLAQFSNFPEMCSFLCFGMGFCLYSNNEISDITPVEVLGAGQFTDTLVMFLVGLTGNGTTAKFSIRCRNNALRDAMASIIKAQISK